MAQVNARKWVQEIPLVTGTVMLVSVLVSLICLCSPALFLALANLPNDTASNLQLYRLFTAVFVHPRPISLILQVIFFAIVSKPAENAAGSLVHFSRFWVNSTFYPDISLQIAFLAVSCFLTQLSFPAIPAVYCGLWSVIMCEFIQICNRKPEAQMQ